MKQRNFFPAHKPSKKHCRTAVITGRSQVLLGSVLAGCSWLAVATATYGQAVPMGAATNFPVVSAAGVTSAGFTVINGDVALSPLTTMTGFTFSTTAGPGIVNGTVHYNDTPAQNARADSFTAYNTMAGMAYVPANDLTGLDLGGMTLAPGVYHFETSAGLTGALTLATGANANAVYVFQVGSTLTAAVGSSVIVTGAGAASPNIFWQVGSSATLNTNSSFDGSILALASVSMGTGSTLNNGRAIALTGAVSLLGNTVNSTALVLAAPGRYWNGSATNLWSGITNWSTTAAGTDFTNLGSAMDVVFSVTSGAQRQNTILDSNTTISSLTVNDTAAVTINGANTLTLSATGLLSGININNGAGLTTINSNLVLGNLSQIVTVNNAAGLRINGVIGGSNGLTKAGTGLLTLTGAETYTGATVVSGGTLQLGDGLTAGTSIASSSSVSVAKVPGLASILAIDLKSGETFGNNVTISNIVSPDIARLQWIASGTNTQASGSIFSGTGDMRITGTGTTVLLGTNTFSGGTTVNTPGTVLVGNLTGATSSAFGSGVLTINNGYVDTFNSKSLGINVGGYVQTGGEIDMHLGGTALGSYTRYNVTGTASLSGGTVFVYDDGGNYVPKGAGVGNPVGDQQNIIHTTAGLTGQFASNAPYSRFFDATTQQVSYYHQGDTLLYPTVTYDPANAYITWVQDSFQDIPTPTENQTVIGGVIDIIAQDPQAPGDVVDYLNGLNVADLPAAYDLIAPDELTAIFQIGFANAEIQNTNIERHLELVRQTSDPVIQTDSMQRTHDSKGGVVEQTRTTQTQDSHPWSIFVEGTGGSATVDRSSNASGYDYNTFGMTLGADLRVNDHFAVGVLGAYANSDASLVNNGSIDVNSYKAALYATAYSDGFYVDALLGAGYNTYDTKRASLLGYAEASPDGWEFDSLLNGGYDFHQGGWTFGPTVSLAYTHVALNSFTETGSLSPLSYPDQSQESLRSNLGARIAYTAVVNGMKFMPQVRIAWQHEYLDSTQSMDSQFASGAGPMFTVSGPSIDRDRAIVSAGLSVQITPTLAAYAFYDGQLGSSSYTSNSVSAGLKFDF